MLKVVVQTVRSNSMPILEWMGFTIFIVATMMQG